jgi:hypothetical protein
MKNVQLGLLFLEKRKGVSIPLRGKGYEKPHDKTESERRM